MKIIIIIFLTIFYGLTLYGVSPYTTKFQDLLSTYKNIHPYIGFENKRYTRRLIPYDYIHNSYKKVRTIESLGPTTLLGELSKIDVHLTMDIGADFSRSIFYMPSMYLMVSRNFYPHWSTSIKPFITVSSKFDLGVNTEPTADLSLYDAGIETIFFTRILISMRTRSVNDVNGFTFMLMPSVIDSDSYNANTPHWYLPRIENQPGFRAGLIGNYYEVSYSQGFWEDSIPLAALVKFNFEYFEVSALYQNNSKSSLSPDDFDFSQHLFQVSSAGKIPLLDEKLWINLLLEYTLKVDVAHYIRNEIGIEYSVFNIAIRPMFYLPYSSDNNVNKDNSLFLLEYTAYIKYNQFTFGFQGSTDERYYLMGKIVF